MATNSMATNSADREMVDKSLSTNPPVYHPEQQLVDRMVDTPNLLKNNTEIPLSTFFSLKHQKEEKERKEGVLAHSGKSFETKVDKDESVDADLTGTDWATELTQAWQTYAAHKDGADIQTMRDLWRASDKEMRKVINAMMGVG